MPRLEGDRTERLLSVAGTPPSLIQVPPGCAFHPRCQYADLTGGASQRDVPPLRETAPGHLSACHLTVGQRRQIWEEQIQPKTTGAAR
jgi:peptide/nickel transport system ATP-binding protein